MRITSWLPVRWMPLLLPRSYKTMAHKFPLFVRQNFSVKPTKSGDGYALKCSTCGETLSILRPPAGMPVEEHGLHMLRRHVESHLIPCGMKSYRVVGGDLTDLVVAQTTPSCNADGHIERYDQVYKVGTNYYMVLVYAANIRHAKTKAQGLIATYKQRKMSCGGISV